MRTEIATIHARLNAGDLDAAVRLAREAYLNDIIDPIVLSLMAHRLEEQGEFDGALRLLIDAVQLDPSDETLHANIGHCFLKMALPNRALDAFNQALLINKDTARAHYGAGLALFSLGETMGAADALRRAHELQPLNPEPLGALALVALHNRQMDLAGFFSDMTLDLDANEPNGVIVRARLLFETKDYDGCIAFLAPHLAGRTAAPLQRSQLERISADAYDAQGRFAEAFAHYDRYNLLHHEGFARRYQDPNLETAVQLCDRLQAYFAAYEGTLTGGEPAPRDDAPREHVFLLGFPRSGTTLLEQVLATHPDVVALEEKATLNEAIDTYFMLSNSIEDLVNASDAELDAARAVYWDNVRSEGVDYTGKVFVDKQPSLTLYVPLLKRLFPKARILFCIRDPRDVVLSCYRRAFVMNTTIYQFTRLDTLCAYYSRVMALGETYFDRIDMPVYRHTHEAFVADFDGSLRNMCAFLQITYDPNMRNFVDTALKRDIRTPSAAQVRAGLNSTGIGYWRNYAEALAPHQAALAPWVKKFGYEPN